MRQGEYYKPAQFPLKEVNQELPQLAGVSSLWPSPYLMVNKDFFLLIERTSWNSEPKVYKQESALWSVFFICSKNFFPFLVIHWKYEMGEDVSGR